MNFEGTILSLGSLELPRLEALIELLFLAAYADGTISAEERAVLRQKVLEGSQGRLSTETVEAMLDSIEATLAQQGREVRFQSIRRRLGERRLRLEALALAGQILRADHQVDLREASWMARAAEALEIPTDEALALLRPVAL